MSTNVNPNLYNFLMKHRGTYNILDILPKPDLILIADEDGYEFAVHKLIMFSGSTHFKPRDHDMDRIVVRKMTSELLDLIITSIYGGTVDFVDFDFAKQILNVASKWGLKLLIELASDYVYTNMTHKRCYEIYDEAYKLRHQPDLLECATKYVNVRVINA